MSVSRGTDKDVVCLYSELLSEKAREFQENIYFYFIDYTKSFDCVDHNTLENS